MENFTAEHGVDNFIDSVIEELYKRNIDLSLSTMDFVEDCFENNLTINESIEVLLIYEFSGLKKY